MRPAAHMLLRAAMLTLLMFPGRAHAETIVITGGFLTSTGVGNFGVFDFSGAGFKAVGSTDMGFVNPSECSPCDPGSVVNLSANLSGRLNLGVPIIIDGAPFSNPADASFIFSGPLIVLPGVLQDFTVTRPFTFSGSLVGLDESGQHDVFFRPLAGHGTLTAQFRTVPLFDDVRGFGFASIRYEFESADPVPEPFTLLLVGSGLGGIALRARRRGRQSVSNRDQPAL